MSEKKLEVLLAPERLGISVTETCRRYGISRETFYTWRRRYQATGLDGLEDHKRGPKRPPARLDPAIEHLILDLRRQHPNWGARKLRAELTRRRLAHLPATSTIHTILKRTGQLTEHERRPHRVPRRGTDTRRALIDAAIDLWADTGWQITGIAAVAERAGVSDATLIHHFGTRDNFLLQVLAELDRRELDRVERWGPPTGLDVIRRLPDMARAGLEHPGLWRLHLMLQAQNLDPDGPAYRYYVQRQHYNQSAFADAIRAGQQSGEIRPEVDPDLVATRILAFILGMRLHIEHGPEHIDPVTVFEDFAQALIRELTPTRPGSPLG
jgi:AcrR family transcriptional regulator/transposase-like protein